MPPNQKTFFPFMSSAIKIMCCRDNDSNISSYFVYLKYFYSAFLLKKDPKWLTSVVLNVGDNAPQGAISFFRGGGRMKRGGVGALEQKGAVGGRWSKPNL